MRRPSNRPSNPRQSNASVKTIGDAAEDEQPQQRSARGFKEPTAKASVTKVADQYIDLGMSNRSGKDKSTKDKSAKDKQSSTKESKPTTTPAADSLGQERRLSKERRKSVDRDADRTGNQQDNGSKKETPHYRDYEVFAQRHMASEPPKTRRKSPQVCKAKARRVSGAAPTPPTQPSPAPQKTDSIKALPISKDTYEQLGSGKQNSPIKAKARTAISNPPESAPEEPKQQSYLSLAKMEKSGKRKSALKAQADAHTATFYMRLQQTFEERQARSRRMVCCFAIIGYLISSVLLIVGVYLYTEE